MYPPLDGVAGSRVGIVLLLLNDFMPGMINIVGSTVLTILTILTRCSLAL